MNTSFKELIETPLDVLNYCSDANAIITNTLKDDEIKGYLGEENGSSDNITRTFFGFSLNEPLTTSGISAFRHYYANTMDPVVEVPCLTPKMGGLTLCGVYAADDGGDRRIEEPLPINDLYVIYGNDSRQKTLNKRPSAKLRQFAKDTIERMVSDIEILGRQSVEDMNKCGKSPVIARVAYVNKMPDFSPDAKIKVGRQQLMLQNQRAASSEGSTWVDILKCCLGGYYLYLDMVIMSCILQELKNWDNTPIQALRRRLPYIQNEVPELRVLYRYVHNPECVMAGAQENIWLPFTACVELLRCTDIVEDEAFLNMQAGRLAQARDFLFNGLHRPFANDIRVLPLKPDMQFAVCPRVAPYVSGLIVQYMMLSLPVVPAWCTENPANKRWTMADVRQRPTAQQRDQSKAKRAAATNVRYEPRESKQTRNERSERAAIDFRRPLKLGEFRDVMV